MKGRISMEDERQNQEKKFVFPENVESSYGIFLGLSIRELLIYVLPTLIVGIIFISIPPHSLNAILIKTITVVIILTIVVAILSTRPVKNRNNVRLIPHLKLKSKYKSRQRLFFKEPRNRR